MFAVVKTPDVDWNTMASCANLRDLGTADGSGEFSDSAQIAVKLSPDWKRENIRVVVFAQDIPTRRIYAVTSTSY